MGMEHIGKQAKILRNWRVFLFLFDVAARYLGQPQGYLAHKNLPPP